MTVGERIAQLRKEHTLSQEELGEQLNVSRQAIYKWERNASLPEIEKLIALSKLFGVSVGYLLGVEEQHAQSDPETAPGELSEQQTKLAEEIASRYIAALPQTAKRKKWPYVAAAAAAVAVLLALSTLNGKLNRLDQQYQNLQNSIVNIQDTVSNQIGGISNRVEEVLKSQNTLTADYSTELLRADPAAGTVTFALRAVPKTYVDSMQAVFSADTGTSTSAETTDTTPSGQEFSAELTCPLTDDIRLNVTFLSGDKKETQLLMQYDSLYSGSFPSVSVEAYNLMYHKVSSDGLLTLQGQFFTADDSHLAAPIINETLPPAEIVSLRVGLFLNQRLLAWAEPGAQPDSFHGDYPGTFYHLPMLEITLHPGDLLCPAAVIEDSCGRTSVVPGSWFWWDQSSGELTWADYEAVNAADQSAENWQF